ncbi:conserved hypothetical protein [Leishmania infantum JPCM5]|uniref:Uncharacterized protein n=2 Tax=Leishmania infantum TaxID=5671 RepID=A4HWR6_LEIIN|nr:conserved hypothetical protein [Leishmania infantum JPCM5]CAC9474193.1 hypothetical_protein_-_conserved [Leishmania infantum]CAM66896.2 conserved hypothetical protein [Leishmania infantum JPCM5]SUZ40595.1 hypothetical_protein_-_conserved [Leishmania infantum]|eukprot:XP_001464507.2 conserved hypothetical protein [Leishmania infantum JPCM5]
MAGKDFDTSLFLKFLFSVIFLFLCCFSLMLYIDKVVALLLVFMLRFLVLPRNIRLSFSGLHIAPLQARVLFRGFSLQTENISLRIVDGYFTFAFWGFWFRHPRWARLREYMIGEALIGTRCRVRHNLHYVKGTIVAVDAENKKVSVQFDEHNTNGSSLDEDEDVAAGEDRGAAEPSPNLVGSAPGNLRHNSAAGESSSSMNSVESQNVRGRGTATSAPLGPRRSRWKEFSFSPMIVPLLGQHSCNEARMHPEGLGDEVVKAVDVKDVYIRSRAGLLQLHLNGVRLCVYNATGKYLDLARAATAGERAFENRTREARKTNNESSAEAERRDNVSSAGPRNLQGATRNGLSGLLQAIGKYVLSYKEAELEAQGRDDAQESFELRAARKLQEHNILTTSFAQKFFNFIGCVEVEICAAQLDIGSAASSHPYFLHFTFQQGEGRVFLTKDSCPALDLYRSVVELTLREVDIRMAQMDSKLSKTQVMRNATLLERARLLVSGVAVPYDHMPLETTASSELIDDYGIFMDGKNKGTVHLVFYKDAPNVYAGEAVSRGALPTTGVEVLIDAPVVRYGPWLEYCRSQLWQYFLPPNYLPLQELQFEVGKPRPNAGFELLVMFLRATTVEIPFKRRSIVPSPPFGIRDSKRKGMIVATVGEGAQYIQPAFFLLPKEEKRIFQGLFIAKGVTLWTNCVLERETVLCNAESLQFFLDRQDDRLWNGRKLWNILAKLSGAKLYWYMVYVDYFLDLINDWQFSACMYHGVPLTTEMYNTVNRVVRDCIPNVKRFEVFLESLATVYLNVNTRNVVYADDPNDLAHNVMAILTMQSGCFNIVLPSDQYQLSFENEAARPMEASAREVKAYLSLPASHPLYDQVSSETPWAYAESFRMQGLFTMLVPNQSIPLPRNNFDTTTGRTRYHNFFNLDLELMNLRGTLMGTHIKALLNCFENTFLDNTFTVAPDELFWLLAKLQSHATTGKNKRKAFKEFLERSQPAANDVEVCVTVRLVDVSATATTSSMPLAPQVNLSTGLITFTYVKQFSVTDTGVSLTPLTVRFPDRRGNFPRNSKSHIVIGAITVGLTKHFGRMPLKPKVHEAMEVHVGGVSLEVAAEQLVMLVEVAQTVARHFAIEDAMMEAEVAEALTTAELSAEKVIRCSPLRNTTGVFKKGMRRRHVGQSSVPSICRSAAVGEEVAMSTGSLFGGPTGDYDGTHGDDYGNGAVEMREWRSAQRTRRLPACHSFPAGSEGGGDGGARDWADAGSAIVVDVSGQAHAEPISLLTASAVRGACAGGATAATNTSIGEGDCSLPILHSYESDSGRSSSGKHWRGFKRRRRLFSGLSPTSSSGSDDDCSGQRWRPFASQVAYDVALEFAKFREECNKADDDSRDYGLFFLLVDVGTVAGVVRIGEDGYAFAELPLGVTVAHSTVNDGNSNKRMSIAMKYVGVQLLLNRTSEVAQTYLPSLKGDASAGEYLEVLSLRTSVCMRQYVAYPFDNSLANHRRRQQQFVEENDYEHLISFPFNKTSTQCPTTPARASGPESTAMAPETPRGEEEPPWTSRAQSCATPVAETATLPCSPQPNATSPPSTTNGFNSLLHQASAASSAPIAARDGMLPKLPLTLARGDDGDAAAMPPLPRAFTSSTDELSLPSSPNSQNTMVHTHLACEADDASRLQSTLPSISTTFQAVDKDNQMSHRFATCVSVSSPMFSSGVSSPDIDSFFDASSSGSLSQQRAMNRAFAVDGDMASASEEKRAAHRKNSSDGGIGTGNSTEAIARPGNNDGGACGRCEARTSPSGGGADSSPAASSSCMTAPHFFYRTFDKAESDEQGTCAVDYWPSQRPSNAHRVRDHTRFHARLPIVGFCLNANRESRAPPFFSYSKRQMLQREEDLFAWARCIADNRERSQNNSTSRHLHIAFLDPLTLLVTPEAAVLASAATQLALRAHHSLRSRRSDLPRDLPTLESPGAAPSRAAQPLLLRPHAKKSKARTQQQRWLWESNIVSVAVPTVEVKLLTRLPVPVENLPSEPSVTDGVYTSTVVVRNLRVLMAQNRPPTGEDTEAKASQRMSVSVKVDTAAAITQIEWEPMGREGNLAVKVPGFWYNADKDTLAVVFLTQVAGKVKRDLWRGADGGASNITVSDVAAYVTRDFADYVHGLMYLVQDVTADVRRRTRVNERFFFPTSQSTTALNLDPSTVPRTASVPAAPAASGVFGRAAGFALREAPHTRKGRVVQGKGFVGHLAVTLIDTVRSGQRIAVNQTKMSRLDIRRPFCNFVVVTPNLLRDRNVHVQGFGEVDEMSARVFPSLLHILHPRAARRSLGILATAAGSPKSINSRTPSFQPNVVTTASTMMFAQSSADTSATVHSSGHIGAAGPPSRPLAFIYDGTFTVHQLDLRAQQSDTNYIQLTGKDLTGCAESRAEGVASRECVQTEALTESISETLKERLRYKAKKARERAKRSRYPAPPETTEQLQLRSTASFFAQEVQVHYVADCLMESISHDLKSPLRDPADSQSMKTSKVFTAAVTDVALVAQFSQQVNLKGDQVNLHMMVHSAVFQSPHCVRAADTLHPQVHALISSWRQALHAASRTVRPGSTVDKLGSAIILRRGSMSSSAAERGSAKLQQSRAVTFQVQATRITGFVGLAQGIVQKFLLPQISCFTKTSSNGRADLKLHLHPFTITSHNTPLENYSVVLPHVYILYAHDTIKMLCSVTVGTIAITITPLFINHSLLTYEKLIHDVAAVIASPKMHADDEERLATEARSPVDATDATLRRDPSRDTWSSPPTTHVPGGGWSSRSGLSAGFGSVSPTDGNPSLEGATAGKDGRRDRLHHGIQSPMSADEDVRGAATEAAAVPRIPMRKRRRSFLFLLQGVRLSYLTSMTTLRFTIRSLNATADTTEGDTRHVLHWVVNATNAQAALVDRDDHDQMVATYNSLSQHSRVASRETHGSSALYATSHTSSSGRATDVANTMKAAHPLSGFLWGSIALSFTLSSGKVDDNRARAALQESTSLGSYSEELQKALLDSLTTSTSKWELAVFEPLVLVRFGLDSLIKQCVRETEEDIRAMKEATYEADLSASTRLRQHKRFQRLQEEKKRIDRFIKRAEKERHRKLRTMTERVVHDVTQRRGIFPTDAIEGDALLDFFRIRRSHKVVASVSNFMVVVPFGDAAYRSVLEEMPGTFACGKTDRHIHTASCLSRRRFIPSFALKMKMNDVSFICSFEVVKHIVPVLVADQHHRLRNDSMFVHAGTTDQDYTTSLLFHGRLLALNSHLYFSDGSPLNKSAKLLDLLRDTPILGGQGVLTSYAAEEHRRSLNSISVVSVEAPLCIEKKSNTLHIGVVVDVSEPKVRMSSRILSIVRELSQEQTALPLQVHMRARRRGETPSPPPRLSRNTSGGASSVARGISGDSPSASIGAEFAAAQPELKGPLSLHLDVTGRLEASELAVFCYSNPEKWCAESCTTAAGAVGGGGARAYSSPRSLRTTSSPVARRCVSFETPSSQNNRMRAARDARAVANATAKGVSVNRSNQNPPRSESGDGIDFYSNERFLIMSVPLPGVTLRAIMRRGRRDASDDVDVVRVEVRAGTIELSPSMAALAQEVEMCARTDEQNRVERNQKIIAFVQSMEAEVPQLRVPLHCPLVEVLVPMPRAYESVLSQMRLDSVAWLRRTDPSARTPTPLGESGGSTGAKNLLNSAVVAVGHNKSRGIVAVHVSISDLRLIFNSEPVASTHFMLYLDQGGTINFVFKYFERPDPNERFVNKFPDASLVVTMRSVRAECQTKLEVKSLEVTLPEAELAISRRSGHIGVVDSVSVYLPFNVEGSEPNLTARLQHMSQVFLVVKLWSITTSETLRTARRLFERRSIANEISPQAARTRFARQVAKTTTAFQDKLRMVTDHRTLVYLGLSRAVCFFDLGAGSTHSFTIGSANVVAEYAKRANGCTVSLLLGRISNTSIRSEGVLSGGMMIGDVMAKAFVIQNSDDTEGFVRSPEQRTFREALLMQQVHVNFKERQLKDIFECKVGSFHANSMDGIGEEEYTTTDMDIMLQRGTLGVTPSTVPAFLSFVRNISAVVAEQRCIAATRMKETTLPFPAFQGVADDVSSTVTGLQKPMPIMCEHSTESRSRSGSELSVATQRARVRIPFMGNAILRVPCGQLRVGLEKTTVLLGAIASGEAAVGCVVLSFPKARLSFAECPCEDYTAAKKVLVIESHNVEVYRPGTPRVVVMGFQGVNYFEFYTRQVLGSAEVGFALTLRQTHPWTGNPRFRDFEEMISLIKSFTDKKNAAVFQHFGRLDTVTLSSNTSSHTPRRDSGNSPATAAAGTGVDCSRDASLTAAGSASTIGPTATAAAGDMRTLKALRSSTFSPQLRFGGDVSVNTEVILNWLGVTEKMLPHVVHTALCDKLEKVLYSLSDLASERVTHRQEDKSMVVAPAASGGAVPRGFTGSPSPISPSASEPRRLDL